MEEIKKSICGRMDVFRAHFNFFCSQILFIIAFFLMAAD